MTSLSARDPSLQLRPPRATGAEPSQLAPSLTYLLVTRAALGRIAPEPDALLIAGALRRGSLTGVDWQATRPVRRAGEALEAPPPSARPEAAERCAAAEPEAVVSVLLHQW